MKNYLFASTLAIALAAAGCAGFEHTSTTTGPTTTGVAALMGTWASASNPLPSPSSCADFKWNATEQTGTTAKGSFSATCAGNLKVAGTAQGVLNGSGITWSAEGDATTAGIACHINLAGTAELAANSIRVPYSGDTCVGKVSGVEILNRK
jgi:cytoskeletal protein CcmA (bactofilin family)